MASPGTVYLVGAGPGDPGLLTLRGRDLLACCDTVVYDTLANPDIVDLVPDGAERAFVGKRGGAPSARQREIDAMLIRLGREGKRVVRLKGGDPLVFGRGSEEAQALAAAGIPFEIVPGVTAGVAAPAYAGIPVTHRGLATAVTFVTGHEDPSKTESGTDWAALARVGGTIVLYMGASRLAAVAVALIAGGRAGATPAAMVEWGTYPRQRTAVATLATLADVAAREGLGAPAITIIGDVVALRDELAWFDRRPLHGRRIVVTRARAQASELRARLEALGAEVIEAPAIRIAALDGTALDGALERIESYQWLVLASRNAVELTWAALRRAGRDARALAGVRVAAVGEGTAVALLACGVAADVVPARAVAEGLVEVLGARDDVRGTRALFPRAVGGRDVLPAALAAMGAEVDEVPIYESVVDDAGATALRAALDGAERGARAAVDLVTFTSSSTVRHFVDAVGAARACTVRGASIGPVTTATAREMGIDIVAEAATATIPALVEAVREALA